MKKKGFTLIELLAVIVILSVITLITIPMITNVIEESKDHINPNYYDNMNDEVWTNLYADSANIHKLYLNGSMTATSQCTFNAGIVARGKSTFILPVGGSGIVLNIDCKTNGGTVYMQGIERGGDHSKTSEGTLRCVTIDGHNVLVLGD